MPYFLLLFLCYAMAYGQEVIYEQLVTPPDFFINAGTPTLVEVEPNVLLCAFRAQPPGAPNFTIWQAKRNKNGKWSTPVEVAKINGAPPTVILFDPVLFKLTRNELIMFYKAGTSPREATGYLIRSFNNGDTWSEPEILPGGVIGCNRTKPFLLKDGTLLCGSSLETFQANDCWIDVTKDGGATWSKRGPIVLPDTAYGIIQPSLFRGRHNTFKMLCRPTGGLLMLCTATSYDQGLTWTTPQVTNIPNSGSPIDTQNISNGRLLLVNNPLDVAGQRNVLVSSLSYDYGETFSSFITLENSAVIKDRFEAPYLIAAACSKDKELVYCVYASTTYEPTKIAVIKFIIIDVTEKHAE